MAGSAAIPSVDRPARAIALICAVIAVLAGTSAAWRWERTVDLADGVPLPRRAALLEEETAVGRQGDTCRSIAQVRGNPDEVVAAYESMLAARGWIAAVVDGSRRDYARDGQTLVAAVGQRAHEPGWSRLRIQLHPCAK